MSNENNNDNGTANGRKPENQKTAQEAEPNRAELISHLARHFTEARTERRSYRSLRVAFTIALAAPGIIRILTSPTGSFDVATSLTALTAYTALGATANEYFNLIINRLTQLGREADKRIQKAIEEHKEVFEKNDFISYLDLSKQTKNDLKQNGHTRHPETWAIHVVLTLTFGLAATHLLKNDQETPKIETSSFSCPTTTSKNKKEQPTLDSECE